MEVTNLMLGGTNPQEALPSGLVPQAVKTANGPCCEDMVFLCCPDCHAHMLIPDSHSFQAITNALMLRSSDTDVYASENGFTLDVAQEILASSNEITNTGPVLQSASMPPLL